MGDESDDLIKRRSPHGERGLKFNAQVGFDTDRESRSPHGERGLKWMYTTFIDKVQESLPPRGAWIEIYCSEFSPGTKKRRSPHGERGLKSHW